MALAIAATIVMIAADDTSAAVDDIAAAGKMMDFKEFAKFGKEWGLLPHLFDLDALRSMFHAANVGKHADDNRGKLSYPEFLACVRQCVSHATAACGHAPLPDGVATLKDSMTLTLQSPP